MSQLTTIKVPVPLRQRIKAAADAEGIASATLLEHLLSEYDRRVRMSQVKEAYQSQPDADYRALTEEWDSTSGDGLGEA